MRISAQHHLDSLLTALPPTEDGEATGGRSIEDDADYSWLDEEMVKVGTLRHAEIDWRGAEARALRFLSEQGKDLKVLGYLLHCLQQEGDSARFALSMQLLKGVLESWWEEAQPFSGVRGVQARKRLFRQFAQRSLKLASALDFSHDGVARHQACQEATRAVIASATALCLPLDELIELNRCLDRMLANNHETTPPGPDLSADTGDATCARRRHDEQASSSISHAVPEVHLEAGNQRNNRQAMLKMADFLEQQSYGNPLGYRLRRYAIWHNIQALPTTRDGRRTELAPVSRDRVAEYKEAIAQINEPTLWRRLEASLAVSPFWLEGHRLSAEAAIVLGHPRCAEAIQEEAQRFVKRLTGIDALTFDDGTEFVDPHTQRWLDGTLTPTDFSVGDRGEAWHMAIEEAKERLAHEGLQSALNVLDAGLAAAPSARDKAYWRLAYADLLDEAGLAALARQHYQSLLTTLTSIDPAKWEPALFAKLDASLATQ